MKAQQLTTEQFDNMIKSAMREAKLIYEFKQVDRNLSARGRKALREGAADKLQAILKSGKTRDFETVGRGLAKVYADNIGQLSDAAWRKLLELLTELLQLSETGKSSPEQLYVQVLRVVATLRRKDKEKAAPEPKPAPQPKKQAPQPKKQAPQPKKK